ncbi:transcriptional regulator [Acidithiobacillus caldus]
MNNLTDLVALHKAISFFGNQTRLAEAIGVSPMAVSHWIHRKRIPTNRALDIEQATQGAVPRWELRPDLWERPTSPAGMERE